MPLGLKHLDPPTERNRANVRFALFHPCYAARLAPPGRCAELFRLRCAQGRQTDWNRLLMRRSDKWKAGTIAYRDGIPLSSAPKRGRKSWVAGWTTAQRAHTDREANRANEALREIRRNSLRRSLDTDSIASALAMVSECTDCVFQAQETGDAPAAELYEDMRLVWSEVAARLALDSGDTMARRLVGDALPEPPPPPIHIPTVDGW